jgi:putative PIN family toxin of toxin-antitoxin system
VLQAAAAGTIQVIASWPLAEELTDALRRPRLRKYQIAAGDIREVVALLGPLLPSVDIDVEVRDPEDAPVLAAAISGAADAIVTGGADLLQDESVRTWLLDRRVEVISPRGLVDRLA